MNFASDEETGDSDNDRYTQRTKPGVDNIQPSPRKKPPTNVVTTLVSGSTRPSIVNNNPKSVTIINRPQTSIKNYDSDR